MNIIGLSSSLGNVAENVRNVDSDWTLKAYCMTTSGPVKKKKKTKDPMSLISTKKEGVRKELRKLQQKQRSIPRKTSGPPSYNDYPDPGTFDYTDKSVEILTRLSQLDSANKKAASTISEHHRRKKRRKAGPSKDNKAAEEKSAFSDKDFEAFSKEFDFSKLKKK